MKFPAQDVLSLQLQAARETREARYIITAVIGDEYDVGEIAIGPESDVETTRAALMHSVGERLRRLSLSERQIADAIIIIAEAPLLY
jgi:hypothetical protein